MMRRLVALGVALAAGVAVAADGGMAVDCARKLASSVEQRICKDDALLALDRRMAADYQAAAAKATGGEAETLATAQRAWAKVRNDCWKATDVTACVEAAYRNRTAELQARYRLLAPVGSARYQCPGPPPQEAAADYFATEPPTAMVTYAGVSQFMRIAPSGSGARYTGGNRQLWEHQGVALISWGAGTVELRCPKM